VSARVALYGGGGSPFNHAAVFAQAGYEVDFVFPVDVLGGALAAFDAFVMPGGGYRAMQGQLDPLGGRGARAIADFVRDGGLYIGCCAGSYCAAVAAASFVAACPAQRDLQLLDARVWNDDDSGFVGLRSPGVGILHARTVAGGHPVMAGMPERFDIVHYNGPLFEGAEPLSVVAGRSERFTPAEAFLGTAAEEPLVDRAAAAGVANIVAGEQGEGRVVLFGSHPEFGFGLALDDLQAPARMLVNAVEWQLEAGGPRERPAPDTFARRAPVEDALPRVEAAATRLAERTEALRARNGSPAWLERAQAMSVFGLEPGEIWRRGLDEIDRLAAETAERAPGTPAPVLSFAPPAAWRLDGGYHGVAALLEQADELLAQAAETWDVHLPPTDHAYAHAETSPYHLVAGSYLSALGRVASAALLCRAYGEAA
jgi:glutamine amidotransferase-like uncharacterized protein